jgi:hypothetical protein
MKQDGDGSSCASACACASARLPMGQHWAPVWKFMSDLLQETESRSTTRHICAACPKPCRRQQHSRHWTTTIRRRNHCKSHIFSLYFECVCQYFQESQWADWELPLPRGSWRQPFASLTRGCPDAGALRCCKWTHHELVLCLYPCIIEGHVFPLAFTCQGMFFAFLLRFRCNGAGGPLSVIPDGRCLPFPSSYEVCLFCSFVYLWMEVIMITNFTSLSLVVLLRTLVTTTAMHRVSFPNFWLLNLR